MISVDTWPKAVQTSPKAAHISPWFCGFSVAFFGPRRFRGRLAGTRFEGFVANHLSDHLRQLWRLHAKFVSGTSVPASPYNPRCQSTSFQLRTGITHASRCSLGQSFGQGDRHPSPPRAIWKNRPLCCSTCSCERPSSYTDRKQSSLSSTKCESRKRKRSATSPFPCGPDRVLL